ncbi:universal stress protein [Mycolicibacterium sp. BiH015]|uniref:universal stress protein n=1 Tax=Mycolicibacterium sp. BiH015 TaxID=3018808 RepID=UPI0022E076ED|nr:universal stress protein [Mycolicibacterium sp. BiH015]MDA2890267.1 universal stress protein [Mycolicibacterium sp. BiH015]
MTTGRAPSGIVVGVDGSQEAGAAVRWAAREAHLHGLPITLMHAVRRPIVTWPLAPSDHIAIEGELQNAEDALKHARQAALAIADQGQPLDVHIEIPRSGAVEALVDASKDAHMVVVGSRGMGRIGRLLLGSVSSGLIHHARCPVTVVRSRMGELPDDGAPILLGVDGSPVSEAATALAFEEASRRGVDLMALHAWSDVGGLPLQGEEWRTRKQQAEEILAERLAGWQERYPDVKIRRQLEFDEPARQLVDRSGTAQLVVVGSHGRGGFSGMLLGSVSSAVVQSVDIPVTVVRPRG